VNIEQTTHVHANIQSTGCRIGIALPEPPALVGQIYITDRIHVIQDTQVYKRCATQSQVVPLRSILHRLTSTVRDLRPCITALTATTRSCCWSGRFWECTWHPRRLCWYHEYTVRINKSRPITHCMAQSAMASNMESQRHVDVLTPVRCSDISKHNANHKIEHWSTRHIAYLT
jgi:hypothetical protein